MEAYAIPIPFGNELRFLPVVFEKIEKRLKVYVWNGTKYKEVHRTEMMSQIQEFTTDYHCFSTIQAALDHAKEFFND